MGSLACACLDYPGFTFLYDNICSFVVKGF